MDLGLTGKAFLVTGGSSGLGLATAAELRADGAEVVLSARGEDRLREAAASIGAVPVVADQADPSAADRLVATALDAFGRLDGALISVGGPPAGGPLEITDEQWTAAYDSVFLGTLRTLRAVVAALPAEGGSIAMVLSRTVKEPVHGLAISNGLRPGLAMLCKDLADELGPRGIRVNGLLPGSIRTPRLAHVPTSSGTPLGRPGEPAEFGRVAAFLLSPAASYVSGTMVAVDGGATRSL
jgi:3-oxoacyl-[acyl-carrier protein] reductase